MNIDAKLLFTVSPVPLIATAEERHVMVSTAASKAILRAAIDEACRMLPDTTYFPSFEIITNTFNTHDYFKEDRRGVTREGVNHVMRCFFATFTDENLEAPPPEKERLETGPGQNVEDWLEAVCDEEWLELALSGDAKA